MFKEISWPYRIFPEVAPILLSIQLQLIKYLKEKKKSFRVFLRKTGAQKKNNWKFLHADKFIEKLRNFKQ